MDTPIKIKPSALARHWAVSKAYVSQLTTGPKKMPAFTTLADADAWRALNAPPKPALESVRTSSDDAPSQKKNRVPTPPQQSRKENAHGGCEVVDIDPFINRAGDFDLLMVQDAEAMPKIARGLFDRACRANNLAEIANLLKIWAEAAGKAADARQRYLDLMERKRLLVNVDDVFDIVGSELQPLRSSMLKLGMRAASKANPANPQLAQTVIDSAVDDIFKNLDNGLDLARRELQEGRAELTDPANSTASFTPSASSAELAPSSLPSDSAAPSAPGLPPSSASILAPSADLPPALEASAS